MHLYILIMCKNIYLITIFFILTLTTFAQKSKRNPEDYKPIPFDSINKWSFELTAGNTNGIAPYAPNYYQGNPNQFFGAPQINAFTIGVRHMFSPKFGMKTNLGYEVIKNTTNNGSKPFQMNVISLGVEAVVNASRLFEIQDFLGRFGLNFHGGFIVSSNTSQTEDEFTLSDHNKGITEYNGGLTIGVSPSYRFARRWSVFADLTGIFYFRQHFAWDGSYAINPNSGSGAANGGGNNLQGQAIRASLGLSYAFGTKTNSAMRVLRRDEDPKDAYKKIHGDWAVIKNETAIELESMDERMKDMETQMNDTDKDGVPDYLDRENNSIAGVAVDTRGRMVDLNKNGVPDELERYIDKNNKEQDKTAGSVKELINSGYICVYFESAKDYPTDISTDGIAFVLNYLRNNPTQSMDVIGSADEIGATESNEKLATKRAANIRNILIKAGIDGARLNIISNGEDASVDVSSKAARKLVRRVTFKTSN